MLGPGRRELAQLRRYLTIEHGPAEVEQIVLAFEESLHAMADGGFLPPSSNRRRTVKDVSVTPVAAQPPVPGARLGKDPSGKPAWFAPDAARPGKWLRVG